ncbi:unnamed protein product [Amoebophrya sp. A120]|nr:unnamed protein product [Amoebophrya sp. A120]|eukprot:GSA120T00018996001.1
MLFLSNVKRALKEPHSKEGCVSLLQLATPDFELAHFNDEGLRKKALMEINKRVHPDKHTPAARVIATEVFQAMTEYVNVCVKAPTPRQTMTSRDTTTSTGGAARASAPPSYVFDPQSRKRYRDEEEEDELFACHVEEEVSEEQLQPYEMSDEGAVPPGGNGEKLPEQFNAFEVTEFQELADATEWNKFFRRTADAHHDARVMALNWNAQLLHKRKLAKWFVAERTDKQKAKEKFFVHTDLTTIEIKEMILKHGPVISTQFVPTKSLASVCAPTVWLQGAVFRAHYIGKHHPVLLCGWTTTKLGEAWLVKPLGPSDIAPLGHKKEPEQEMKQIRGSDEFGSAGDPPRKEKAAANKPGVKLIPVSIGQFGINKEIESVNVEMLMDQPFQAGPFLGLTKELPEHMKNSWRTLSKYQWTGTAADLPKLFAATRYSEEDNTSKTGKSWKNGIVHAATTESSSVELHQLGMRACSRKAALRELDYDEKTMQFRALFALDAMT